MRRVVVTGLGLVTPLACGVEETWSRLLGGQSGASLITKFKTDDLPTKIACQVPRGDGSDGTFNPDQWVDAKEQRRMDDFIIYGLAAAKQAVRDAGWEAKTDEDKNRTGVLIGSGIGGLTGIEEASILVHERGPRRLSPFFIPGRLINLVSGYVSIEHGFKGPNHSVVTACATGAHAIGDAARLIAFDDADVMIAGGAESAVCRIGIAGFNACRALSTGFNDTPTKASRPYDKDRDGFVMGEGAGIVVLEELDHARKRGATILSEIIGYGMSADAYHITQPAEGGEGGHRVMMNAIHDAKITPNDVDYVNAHGTSTPIGDVLETKAIKRTFPDHPELAVSSTKSMTGHLLGGAGGLEAGITVLALKDQILPPTINLENPDPECDLDYVPNVARKAPLNIALSNSFGFGGTNGSLIFRRWAE